MTTPEMDIEVRLFLDDLRSPPDGSWTVVRTVEDAIEVMRKFRVTEMSLDHDLGMCSECMQGFDGTALTCHHMKTGYDFVLWMVENEQWPEVMPMVHSMNPVGRMNMIRTIQRYYKPPTYLTPGGV